MKSISIIIPVLNEADNICGLLDFLIEECQPHDAEIIVVDGGSVDDTCDLVKAKNVLLIHCEKASRAIQMNKAAEFATKEILYFVHADTQPPSGFCNYIFEAMKTAEMGCFRFKFQSSHLLLKVNSWFTRFDVMWCRGGDQTLFVTRKVFDDLEGYDTYFSIMEEYDFMRRAREKYTFKILPYDVKVSARKYNTNSWLKVQLANAKAVRMFNRGEKPEVIKSIYKRSLNPY